MAETTDDRRVIARSVPDELTAAMLASKLDEAGIEAWVEGGIASGYRAEAPGNANILVRPADLRRAVELLASGAAGAAGPVVAESSRVRFRRAAIMMIAWITLVLLVIGAMVL